ncbi:hypothetical protein EW146_g5087 [Bondarzewia mesenterica]|uniref:Uncharacterized protein n=1 Tax=Bondarzewia mesenterica TaxID=1095465 RepID=A0A4S4LSI6_9AGAM|nr:hypothetical protein EW146_g5087 [Bondarzewia mesenterica]
MPTSELSDALNPHVVQTRPRRAYSDNITPALPSIVQQPQVSYVPHRSELEYAISEPPPPSNPAPLAIASKPRLEGAHLAQELLRALQATKAAHESERKRRIAWEQELDAKYAQRQAEMETKVAEMEQEITCLRAYIATFGNNRPSQASTSQHTGYPLLIEPASTSSVVTISEESTEPPAATDVLGNAQSDNTVAQIEAIPTPAATVSRASSPAPSSRGQSRSCSYAPSSSNRKRRTHARSDEEFDSDNSEASRSSAGSRPLKRLNHHDTRCYTVQTAMRKHIYRLMETKPDEELPPSHLEGLIIGPDEPVRFVWEKTVKQSSHNVKMKARVVADLKANRRLYKHVPDKDFGKKSLESVFDQAFTTFRQKAKGQSDAAIAQSQKAKEEHKALKARRAGRKRLKLSNRIEARQKTEAFSHATFSGALHIDCMSSEESDEESSKAGPSTSKEKAFIVRGIPWRSTRLLKFYGILDEDDKLDKSLKPKRGVGRRERSEGPPKAGFYLPPKGVADWMISRRWLRDMQAVHPELLSLLKDIVVDPLGFDWTRFDALGYESEDELDPVHSTLRSQRLVYPAVDDTHTTVHTNLNANPTSYSLQYALAPVF